MKPDLDSVTPSRMRIEMVEEETPKPVHDPFFENTEKLPPRRELEAQLAKWKRRALAFQEGYKEKSFEVTMQEIQIMDLRAHGADIVTARQNGSLRTKLLAACIERNEAREAVTALSKALAAAVHAMRSYQHGNSSPDLADQIDATATAALALVDNPQTKETK